jgi:hypothetical protein
MKTRLILRNLSVITGLSHLEEKGRGSKSHLLIFWVAKKFIMYLFWPYFNFFLVAILSLSTLSKLFAKVHQRSPGSRGFQECRTCKFLFYFECSCDFTLSLHITRTLAHLCFVYVRHDFQFFNNQRLNELYEKEVRYLMVIYLCSVISAGCWKHASIFFILRLVWNGIALDITSLLRTSFAIVTGNLGVWHHKI